MRHDRKARTAVANNAAIRHSALIIVVQEQEQQRRPSQPSWITPTNMMIRQRGVTRPTNNNNKNNNNKTMTTTTMKTTMKTTTTTLFFSKKSWWWLLSFVVVLVVSGLTAGGGVQGWTIPPLQLKQRCIAAATSTIPSRLGSPPPRQGISINTTTTTTVPRQQPNAPFHEGRWVRPLWCWWPRMPFAFHKNEKNQVRAATTNDDDSSHPVDAIIMENAGGGHSASKQPAFSAAAAAASQSMPPWTLPLVSGSTRNNHLHDVVPTTNTEPRAAVTSNHKMIFHENATTISTTTTTTVTNNNKNNNNNNNNNTKDSKLLDLNLLVIDHYDSFTYNLVDLLGQICIRPPKVAAADCAASWTEWLDRQRRPHDTNPKDQMQMVHQYDDDDDNNDDDDDNNDDFEWDGIVLSPGPGHPLDASMCSLSQSIVRENPTLPILGVCLGHQIMGTVYGASCVPASQPVHGQVGPIRITTTTTTMDDDAAASAAGRRRPDPNGVVVVSSWPSLWNTYTHETLSSSSASYSIYNVTRYHSLQVVWPSNNHNNNNSSSNETLVLLPIVPTAYTVSSAGDEVIVMALQHVSNPHYGVQFHPESIGSQPHGKDWLRQFCQICWQRKRLLQQQEQQQQPQPQTQEEQRPAQRTQHPRPQQEQQPKQREQHEPEDGVNPESVEAVNTTTYTMQNEKSAAVYTDSTATTVGQNIAVAKRATTTTTRTTAALPVGTTKRSDEPRYEYKVFIHKVGLAKQHSLRPEHVMQDFLKSSRTENEDSGDVTTTSYENCFWLDGSSYVDDHDNDNNNNDCTNKQRNKIRNNNQPRERATTFAPNDWTDDLNANAKHTTNTKDASNNKTTISILGRLGDRQRRVEYWGQEKPRHLQGIHEWWWDNTKQAINTTTSGKSLPDLPAAGVVYRHDPWSDIFQYLQRHHAHPTQRVHLVSSWRRTNDSMTTMQEPTAMTTMTTTTAASLAFNKTAPLNFVQRDCKRDCNAAAEATATTTINGTVFADDKDDLNSRSNCNGEQQERHGPHYEIEILTEAQATQRLPFAFRGGHVGYLGYEVRHVTERLWAAQEQGRAEVKNTQQQQPMPTATNHQRAKSIPTAAFGLADQSFVYHHETRDWYLVGVVVVDGGGADNNETAQELYLNNTRKTHNFCHEGDMLNWMQTTSSQMLEWDKNRKVPWQRNDRSPQANKMNGPSSSLSSLSSPNSLSQRRVRPQTKNSVNFIPNRSRDTYNRNFDQCLQYIRAGESYELCLTNQMEATVVFPPATAASTGTAFQENGGGSLSKGARPSGGRSPLDLYYVLRKQNPAPFAAFLDWNGGAAGHGAPTLLIQNQTGSALAICCSSPERFISVLPMANDDDDGNGVSQFQVEAKPIKGTVARILPPVDADHATRERIARLDQERAEALKYSEKDRAENLMIVDLLRNDLSRVCQVGSVHVAKLMDIESYATVHQMVSTIRGTFVALKTENACSEGSLSTTVDVLAACFPGGSMTGAPKVRTMEILNELEEGVPRGPYSGALGYISVNGAIDMNKIIRTAVLTPPCQSQHKGEYDDQGKNCHGWNVSVGAGGAITILSQKNEEYDEMVLKAWAVMNAIQIWANSTTSTHDGIQDLLPDPHTNTQIREG